MTGAAPIYNDCRKGIPRPSKYEWQAGNCGTCRYKDKSCGRCRYGPPPIDDGSILSRFPIVGYNADGRGNAAYSDACGKWKRKEDSENDQ